MIPVLITLPFAVFGMVFQLSFITVGKAGFGAALSVMGRVLNIVLDWLFIAIFHWVLAGAAIATGIGYAFPSITAGEVLSILMSIFYFRKYRNMWSVKV